MSTHAPGPQVEANPAMKSRVKATRRFLATCCPGAATAAIPTTSWHMHTEKGSVQNSDGKALTPEGAVEEEGATAELLDHDDARDGHADVDDTSSDAAHLSAPATENGAGDLAISSGGLT